MENYVPDIYQKSIYTINYDSLLLRGIKCLLFDLDNTIVPITIKRPNKRNKELFDELKGKGFKIIIFSNSTKNRVRPFKEELDVDCCANAHKPFKKNFLKILNEYNVQVSETAIIGDQILTDIAGGNKVGITTILVNPIGTKEKIYTRINRYFERQKLKKMRDNNLFTKGKYYD